MPDPSHPFLPDPRLGLTGDPARDAPRIGGDRALGAQAHWQSLLDRGLIGPPRTPAQEAARAAAEASTRALDRLVGKDRVGIW